MPDRKHVWLLNADWIPICWATPARLESSWCFSHEWAHPVQGFQSSGSRPLTPPCSAGREPSLGWLPSPVCLALPFQYHPASSHSLSYTRHQWPGSRNIPPMLEWEVSLPASFPELFLFPPLYSPSAPYSRKGFVRLKSREENPRTGLTHWWWFWTKNLWGS